MSHSDPPLGFRTYDHAHRYGDFVSAIRADIGELLDTGAMSAAKRLSRATGQHLNHSTFPMFFTGDLDAEFVLVHLNPAQPEVHRERLEQPPQFASFDDYFERHRSFGALHYGPQVKARRQSRFDRKQVVFVRRFGVIEFVDEVDPAARFVNLERVVDRKLQLELVPYGSPSFETHRFRPELLREHLDRVLGAIGRRPRRYVLFCGAAFEPLLKRAIIDDHRFRLTRRDGAPERQHSRFANLRIPFGQSQIRAGLCHSWPRQGLPMAAYADRVHALYSGA